MPDAIKKHKTPSVGVVLTGGGMRGPFQAGVLMGLESKGIQISAISGVSAGALNAVSFIRSGSEATARKWRAIAKERFLKINLVGLLVRLILILFSLPHAVWFRIMHTRNKFDRNSEKITRASTWVRNYIEELEIGHGSSISYFDETTVKALGVSLLLGIIPLFLLVNVLFSWSILGLTIFSILAITLFFSGSRFWRVVNEKGMNSLNLEVAGVLASIPFTDGRKIITFACIAVPKSGFDYRSMRGYRLLYPAMSSLGYFTNIIQASMAPKKRNMLAPRYIRIDTLSPPEQENTAAASAALPLGLIGSVKHEDSLVFDGGIIDNVPIYPLINENLDCIVVADITRKGLGGRYTEILSSHIEQIRYIKSITGGVSGLLKRGKLHCKAARRYMISFSMTHRRICERLDKLLDLSSSMKLPEILVARSNVELSWYSLLYISQDEIDSLIKRGQEEGKRIGTIILDRFEERAI